MIELSYHNDQLIVPKEMVEGFEPEELLFLGMRTLVMGKKNHEPKKYYYTLPIEHTAEFPVSFDEDGGEFLFDEAARIWLAEPLHKAMFSSPEVGANFLVEEFEKRNDVIILNCLDSCYGHSLDKLFNAQRHLKEHANIGLILIIHISLKNLIPDGISEVWIVDVPFKDLNSKIKGLDDFIKSQLKNYRTIHLSKANMNLDYSQLDIEKFTKHRPFPEEKFNSRPKKVTLILREDRFWLTNRLNQLLYLMAVKFKLMKYSRLYFIGVQNRNFRSVVKKLSHHFDSVEFVAVGLGKSGALGSGVEDKRESYVEYVKNESLRCKIYSESHLIIGVHGSHLLLPSALSASFISIHQAYKIQGFSEDFIPRHHNSQRQALLGRFISDIDKPKALAMHAKFILKELSNIS